MDSGSHDRESGAVRMRGVLLALVLFGGGILLAIRFRPGGTRADADSAQASPAEAPRASATPEVALSAEETSKRAPTVAAEPGPDAPVAQPEPVATPSPGPGRPVLVGGLVVDAGGRGVGGLRVTLGAFESEPSDSRGLFELRLAEPATGFLVARGTGWVTVRTSLVHADGLDREHRVIVAPAVPVAGRVVDAAGLPLAGVELSVDLDPAFERRFPYPLDRNASAAVRARSDEAGRFVLEGAPGSVPGADALLVARHEGHERATLSVPPGGSRDLLLELASLPEPEPVLGTGVVLRPDGAPAARAGVHLGEESVRTDEEGRFALDLAEVHAENQPLAATERGLQPAFLPDYGRLVIAARPAAPAPVTLVLGERELSIEGQVVDADDAPLVGWNVSVVDGTILTPNRTPPLLLEALGGGVVEAATHDDGTFLLRGFQDRAYTVRAYDPETLVGVQAEGVHPGDGELVLRVTGELFHERVRGVCVAPDGTPVPGVRVAVAMETSRTQFGYSWTEGQIVLTDEQGVFELLRVPRERIFFSLGGDAIVSTRFAPEPGLDVLALVVPVERRCHLRLLVQGGEPPPGARFEVQDEEGRPLQLITFRGGGSSYGPRMALTGDATRVYAVSERARALVVRGGGDEELLRRPLSPLPGEVVEVAVELP